MLTDTSQGREKEQKNDPGESVIEIAAITKPEGCQQLN